MLALSFLLIFHGPVRSSSPALLHRPQAHKPGNFPQCDLEGVIESTGILYTDFDCKEETAIISGMELKCYWFTYCLPFIESPPSAQQGLAWLSTYAWLSPFLYSIGVHHTILFMPASSAAFIRASPSRSERRGEHPNRPSYQALPLRKKLTTCSANVSVSTQSEDLTNRWTVWNAIHFFKKSQVASF